MLNAILHYILVGGKIVFRAETNAVDIVVVMQLVEIAVDLLCYNIQNAVVRTDEHNGRFSFAINGDSCNQCVLYSLHNPSSLSPV